MRVFLAVLSLLLSGCAGQMEFSKNKVMAVQVSAIQSAQRYWIDTDPSCRPNVWFADSDDCVAIMMAHALRMPIVGISATAGNVTQEEAFASLQMLTSDLGWNIPLYQGGIGCESPTVLGLTQATSKGALSILALGPLTNIEAFVRCHPELSNRLEITAIMGRRPGQVFSPGYAQTILKDLNFELNQAAAAAISNAGIPLRLVPYEAGFRVQIAYQNFIDADIALPRLLQEKMEIWDRLVRHFITVPGMMQFDAVAVASVAWPEEFRCERVQTQIASTQLIAIATQEASDGTLYCTPRDPQRVQQLILRSLMDQRPQ